MYRILYRSIDIHSISAVVIVVLCFPFRKKFPGLLCRQGR